MDSRENRPDRAASNSGARSKRVLVVAGHDPSGAGLDADRAALAGLDVEGLFVVTAHTQQDDRGVYSIGAVDARAWFEAALRHVDGGIDALKFGLLPGAAHVSAAARLVEAARARSGAHLPCVVDPVLAASSGGRFLDARAVAALTAELFGAGVIATPNLLEAAELARLPPRALIESANARLDAAAILLDLGLAAVVVKGGHGLESPARDLVLEPRTAPVWLEHARIEGGQIRGSGCRYATRLAAHLARAEPLESAARAAAAHVVAALAEARLA